MKELFKDAAKITNYNLILTIPLIIFVKVLDLYSMYSKYTVDSVPKFILASITMLFMFGVFCAAWFYMVERAVELSKKVFVLDEDRAKATLNLFKKIPEGIGKFFLSFVGVYLIFVVIQIIASPVVYLIGKGIGFAPMIVLFVGYLIVPLVLIGMTSMMDSFTNMSSMI